MLLNSKGHKESGNSADRYQLVICLQTLQSGRVPEEASALVCKTSEGAPTTANTNPGVTGIITTPCYVCRVVSHPPELWAPPHNHTPSATSENVSLSGLGIKSLSGTGQCWHFDDSAQKTATENSDTEGWGSLLLGGSQVSVLQGMTLVTHQSRRPKEVDWLLHRL